MSTPLPHAHTYTRLGVSNIQGIGVFAIRDIPQGTNIFSDDRTDMVWIEKAIIDEECADAELKKLYTDFCVLRGDKLGCPENFNSMPIGWYINEPAAGTMANVVAADNYDFISTRNIEKGEELTVVYATFSDHMTRY